MKIEFDTNDLSKRDLKILGTVLGFDETVPEENAKAAPVKAAAAKPAAPVKAAAAKPGPKPKPAPEPEPEEDETEDAVEYNIEEAVQLATKLVAKGRSADVKAALSDLGVRRVSELKGEQIGEFISSIDA